MWFTGAKHTSTGSPNPEGCSEPPNQVRTFLECLASQQCFNRLMGSGMAVRLWGVAGLPMKRVSCSMKWGCSWAFRSCPGCFCKAHSFSARGQGAQGPGQPQLWFTEWNTKRQGLGICSPRGQIPSSSLSMLWELAVGLEPCKAGGPDSPAVSAGMTELMAWNWPYTNPHHASGVSFAYLYLLVSYAKYLLLGRIVLFFFF